jgi:hypothetical protein
MPQEQKDFNNRLVLNLINMKKLFSSLTFILSLTELHAQSYQPLVKEGNVWNVEWITFGGSLSITWHYDGYRYWISGDTMIEGRDYKKLYEQRVYEFVTNGYPQYDYWNNFNYPGLLVAGLREDTATKQIWCYDLENFLSIGSSVGDTLLYDFSVSTGDTLKWTPAKFLVTSIDSVQLLNGNWRRRIVLDGGLSSPHYWIEGIGATEVLSQPYFSYFETLSQLTCFQSYDSFLYEEPPYGIPSYLVVNCDSLLTSAAEISNSSVYATLLPTLITDYFHFSFELSQNYSGTFVLLDQFGRKVKVEIVHPGKIYNYQCTMLPKGIYFAQLFFESKSVWKKQVSIQ